MKKVLITGAAGALGGACVSKFVEAGHQVLAILSPGKTLENKKVSTYNADLTNEQETASVVNDIIKEHERIDIALMLVGGFGMGTVADTSGEQMNKMIKLNFMTAYFTSRPIFQHMMDHGGGRLVFIGSKPALEAGGGKGMTGYTISKGMVIRLAELMNLEGASHNVVSTVVAPSVIDTADNRKAMPKADPSKWVTPEQIAEQILFVTSDQASPLRQPILRVYGDS
ncbi:MAG: SDR family NAD(P)-dependent oxidoreductase [Cyclobacteriaceae bacterium]|nr:SDR family NAD(P)-dependent oxidoreductase [Cyclobacteriaceae bacterium]